MTYDFSLAICLTQKFHYLTYGKVRSKLCFTRNTNSASSNIANCSFKEQGFGMALPTQEEPPMLLQRHPLMSTLSHPLLLNVLTVIDECYFLDSRIILIKITFLETSRSATPFFFFVQKYFADRIGRQMEAKVTSS